MRVLALIAALLLALFVAGCIVYAFGSLLFARIVLLIWARAAPRPPLRKALRAASAELVACLLLLPLYPLWLVAGRSFRARPGGVDPSLTPRRPVILVHGLAMNRTNWMLLGWRLASRGIGPLHGFTYFSWFPVPTLAKQLDRWIEVVRSRENANRVDIVAHSLGGIIARYSAAQPGGAERIGRIVTIGTPHRGTELVRFGIGSVADLRTNSRVIAALTAAEGVAFTSIWSSADCMIVPPESASIAPLGTDRVFDDLGHLSLLISPRVAEAVAEALEACPRPQGAR